MPWRAGDNRGTGILASLKTCFMSSERWWTYLSLEQSFKECDKDVNFVRTTWQPRGNVHLFSGSSFYNQGDRQRCHWDQPSSRSSPSMCPDEDVCCPQFWSKCHQIEILWNYLTYKGFKNYWKMLPCKIEKCLELLKLLDIPVQARLGVSGAVQPTIENIWHFSKVHTLIVTSGNFFFSSFNIFSVNSVFGPFLSHLFPLLIRNRIAFISTSNPHYSAITASFAECRGNFLKEAGVSRSLCC